MTSRSDAQQQQDGGASLLFQERGVESQLNFAYYDSVVRHARRMP